jgi:hypothetical protein
MQVSRTHSNNSPSFGMALYINPNIKGLGINTMEQLTAAIVPLKKMAEDVDIFIKPFWGASPNNNALDITVTPIQEPQKNILDKLRQVVWLNFEESRASIKVHVHQGKLTPYRIINMAKIAKDEFYSVKNSIIDDIDSLNHAFNKLQKKLKS